MDTLALIIVTALVTAGASGYVNYRVQRRVHADELERRMRSAARAVHGDLYLVELLTRDDDETDARTRVLGLLALATPAWVEHGPTLAVGLDDSSYHAVMKVSTMLSATRALGEGLENLPADSPFSLSPIAECASQAQRVLAPYAFPTLPADASEDDHSENGEQ